MSPHHLEQVLASYEAAWNEPDAALRAPLLAASVSDSVVMSPGYDPGGTAITGADALSAEMDRMIASRPGGGVRMTLGPPSGHHEWVRFRWRVHGPDGAAIEVGGHRIEGVDIAGLAKDGRLQTIVVFLGEAE